MWEKSLSSRYSPRANCISLSHLLGLGTALAWANNAAKSKSGCSPSAKGSVGFCYLKYSYNMFAQFLSTVVFPANSLLASAWYQKEWSPTAPLSPMDLRRVPACWVPSRWGQHTSQYFVNSWREGEDDGTEECGQNVILLEFLQLAAKKVWIQCFSSNLKHRWNDHTVSGTGLNGCYKYFCEILIGIERLYKEMHLENSYIWKVSLLKDV